MSEKKISFFLYLDKYFLIDLFLKGADLNIKQQKYVTHLLL